MITTKNIDSIRINMNELGKQHMPFLFGINYEMNEGFLIEDPQHQNQVLFQIKGIGNKSEPKKTSAPAILAPQPIGLEAYREMFDTVSTELRKDHISMINLTIRTPVVSNLSLHEIFAQSTSMYQLYIPDRLVCFSPEQFVRISKGKISTTPMKGTIDASIPNAEQVILDDPKELREHQSVIDMVVGEIRNIADEVKVERFRYIDRIKGANSEILQTSSEVVGQLSADYQSKLGDIMFGLLPASSILGVPKERAKKLIAEAEKEERGFYTGIFGYYDGESLDSGVLIRFIEQKGDNMYFRSGGGITKDSVCEKEYQEVLNKIYLHTR